MDALLFMDSQCYMYYNWISITINVTFSLFET